MKDIEVPKLKCQTLPQRLTIPVDTDLKNRLARLKSEHQIDVTEWIRRLIKKGLEQLSMADE